MNGMSKWEMAKPLMAGIAHLATGVALMIGALMGLGIAMDFLVEAYPDGSMPVAVSLIPLLLLLVGVGWGGFFIWKSTMGRAPSIALYLVGKVGYKILGLHRVSIRWRKRGGALVALAGIIMVCAELVPAMIRTFPEPPMSVTHPTIVLIGGVAVLLSMAIAVYQPKDTSEVEGGETWQ